MKYVCRLCGWEYDEALGDPENGIEPGTRFEDLPEDFTGIEDAAPLKCITIEIVRTTDNKVVDRIKMDRINFDSEN